MLFSFDMTKRFVTRLRLTLGAHERSRMAGKDIFSAKLGIRNKFRPGNLTQFVCFRPEHVIVWHNQYGLLTPKPGVSSQNAIPKPMRFCINVAILSGRREACRFITRYPLVETQVDEPSLTTRRYGPLDGLTTPQDQDLFMVD